MKPSVLIFSQAMELGGVERSLLGLLDSIDYDRYDVDLFLMRHSGELMPYLNPRQIFCRRFRSMRRWPCRWRRLSEAVNSAYFVGGCKESLRRGVLTSSIPTRSPPLQR